MHGQTCLYRIFVQVLPGHHHLFLWKNTSSWNCVYYQDMVDMRLVVDMKDLHVLHMLSHASLAIDKCSFSTERIILRAHYST